MALAVCMGLTVTAAAGATFGIVPFITRRGLGAANGIVGSGSSLGGWLFCLSGGREGGLHCIGRRPLHAVGCVARQQRRQQPGHLDCHPARAFAAGSIILQALFFTGTKVDWQQGFLGMVSGEEQTGYCLLQGQGDTSAMAADLYCCRSNTFCRAWCHLA